MRSEFKRFFSSLIFYSSLFFFSELQATSLNGSNSVSYQATSYTFADRDSATGYVRFTNGFSIPAATNHGSCVFMDVCLTVSGAIDLQNTSTMILLSDLTMDNGATFPNSGRIYGYDRSVILDGDLTIPAGKVLHVGGRIAIDGQGSRLILGDSSQLFVDTGATLTLRNLFLQTTKNGPGNPPVQCAATSSQLCLENVFLEPMNDFYFNQGQLWIYGDVAYTGTSTFYYRSTSPSYITSGATLNFDLGTVFDFYPSTTGTPGLLAKDLLNMQDSSSKLYLNGCTFKTTYTGFRVTKGQLLFDNKVSLTSGAQLRLADFSTTVTNWQATTRATTVDWHPSGRYLAYGLDQNSGNAKFAVLGFSGATLTPIAQTAAWATYALGVHWSPDGKYLACAGQDSATAVRVYSFNGSALSLVCSIPSSGVISWFARWSPDGRYLAVASSWGSNQLAIYNFTGSSLTFITSVDLGGPCYGAVWHPNGKTIAAACAGSNVGVYTFTGKLLQPVCSYSCYVNGDLAWSSDGRFLAIALYTNALGQVFYFTDSRLVSVALYTTASSGGLFMDCAWDKTGRYVAFAGQDATSPTYNAVVLQLSGNTFTQIGSLFKFCAQARGIAISPDNNFLAIAGEAADTGKQELMIQALRYSPENKSQALTNSFCLGNSGLGASYDVNVRGLAMSQIVVDGLVNYDCVS